MDGICEHTKTHRPIGDTKPSRREYSVRIGGFFICDCCRFDNVIALLCIDLMIWLPRDKTMRTKIV